MLREILVLSCLAVSSAAAQDAADDGSYWRLGAGAAFIGDLDEDLPATGDSNVIETETSLTFVAALGFDYADGIRTELEYRYLNANVEDVTFTPSGGAPQTLPPIGDISAHLLMSNFYFDFTNSSKLTPFIGGGVGGAFVSNAAGDRDAALALQARAGVSYDLGSKFSLDTEFIYTRSNRLDFDANPATGAPAIASDRLEASSVMASFRKQF